MYIIKNRGYSVRDSSSFAVIDSTWLLASNRLLSDKASIIAEFCKQPKYFSV
jgi:hypothetical protein